MLKKVAVALAMTGLMAGMAYAGTAAKSGINGSAHDINTWGGATDSLGRTCAFCHTPHAAMDTSTGPLWNHAESTQTFTAYTWKSPANTALGTITNPLTGPSQLCMACHDGVVAVDSHNSNGSTLTGNVTGAITGAAKIGTNLKQTHPIGFDYEAAALARNGATKNVAGSETEIIVPATGFLAVAAGTTFDTHARTTLGKTDITIGSTLFTDSTGKKIMTCASCHDVHNTTNEDVYFLRAKESGSTICLSCHVK